MRFTNIKNTDQLWDFMTDPTPALIESVSRLNGSMLVLGGSGKMGKELIGLVKNADKINGTEREITVASTFSNVSDIENLETVSVKCLRGDLSDETFLKSLPDVPYIVYMMGFKFGSSNDWRRAFHLNSIVPYLVGKKYSESSIVVFSSGNPYPHTSRRGSGCTEKDQLSPVGVYGWNIVARESSFKTTAMLNKDQRISFFRLMYAQHLSYGVLIDLAKMVYNNEPISVTMPAVNLVSQRDANEVAIKSFEQCTHSGQTFNVAGPVWSVRKIVEMIGSVMNRNPDIIDEEPDTALLADDAFTRKIFGEYRDNCEDMIEASARWVMNGGEDWGKPTYFGKVKHDY
jgi:nucleoside-diphosphate-sugar epimerase